jgi:hypothetical protein
LRLSADLVDGLRVLGFDRIADLLAQPRAPLSLRFGPELGRRIDQAIGRLSEPIEPIRPAELIEVRQAFAEPIGANPPAGVSYTSRSSPDELTWPGRAGSCVPVRFCDRQQRATETFRIKGGLLLCILDQPLLGGGRQHIHRDRYCTRLLPRHRPSAQGGVPLKPRERHQPEIDRCRKRRNPPGAQALAFERLENLDGPRLKHPAILGRHRSVHLHDLE